MNDFQRNDVVRVGKGKVEWKVTHYFGGVVHLESEKGAKKILNIAETEVTLLSREAPAEKPVKETTSYQKAVLFALNRLGKHVYAGTVSATKKAKTRKLNLRQKASRKANR